MIAPTMKKILLFSILTVGLFANPYFDFSSNQKIAVQNSILARVNGKTISMMDVKKKMDLIFHQNYPDLIDSNQSRIQFYEASWKQVLTDLIDNELVISDAIDKEIKVTDGEVREVMEERFGPNVMQTLDTIGLGYDETWKMVTNELIAQRMNWWFIQSKAMANVTPQDIRQAYKLFLKENPPYSEWKYQVISIRTNAENETLSNLVYKKISELGKAPNEIEDILKELETPDAKIAVSKEFVAKSQDISSIHKASLETLTPGNYSKPTLNISRADKKMVYRIFYLSESQEFPAPSFDAMSNELRNQLIGKQIVQESSQYLGKLRKHYGFETNQTIPDDLQPFSLQ